MAVYITYYVHSTTTDNLEKLSTGWLPGKLSEKGIMQANALKEFTSKEKFDVIFASDLQRAIESANIFLIDSGLTINTDSRIRECNYGVLNGKKDELVVYADHITTPFEEGESLVDVENRIKDFLLFLTENYDGKSVALVAHKAPQLAIEKIVRGYSWEEALEKDWRNTKAWQPGWKYTIEKEMLR